MIEGVKTLINICYDMSDNKTRQREINGLIQGMNSVGVTTGFLITKDAEERVEIEDKTILVVPLWKWLLSSGK